MHWTHGGVSHYTGTWNNFWVYSALFFNLPPVLNAIVYSKELLDDPLRHLFSSHSLPPPLTLIFGDIVSLFSSSWSEKSWQPHNSASQVLRIHVRATTPPSVHCSVCRAIIWIICFYSSFLSLLYLCLLQSHLPNYTEIVVNTCKWRLSLCKLGSASEI